MNILLFDMDDVLVHPHGYHRALQETVALIGQALGFQDARLTPEVIAEFEAAGSTSEWDTSAICAALLLERTWRLDPARRLPDQPPLPAPALHELPPPDFGAFARVLARSEADGVSPRVRAESLMLGGANLHNHDQAIALRNILRHAREEHHSLTFRLFQELALGSESFCQAYGLPPYLQSAAYLEVYDLPTLTPAAQERLALWLAAPGHSAAIFTNRPSRSPDGDSGTPEAEIGARVAGVDHLPIVGLGGLAWLSNACSQPPEAFLKPSPVHVLAALRVALGNRLEPALTAAARLHDGHETDGWEALAGAEVAVFEDAAKGLRSALAARDVLARYGVQIGLRLYGVTSSPPKRKKLRAVGGTVFPDLENALDSALARH